jgi:hypothetical protein
LNTDISACYCVSIKSWDKGYVEDLGLLSESIGTAHERAETLLGVSMELGLEANAEKAKCVTCLFINKLIKSTEQV